MSTVKPAIPKGSASQNYKKALLIWNVPPDLRRAFKSRCAAEGRTMQAVLLEFMRDYSTRK